MVLIPVHLIPKVRNCFILVFCMLLSWWDFLHWNAVLVFFFFVSFFSAPLPPPRGKPKATETHTQSHLTPVVAGLSTFFFLFGWEVVVVFCWGVGGGEGGNGVRVLGLMIP